MSYMCLVCGYDNLAKPPRDYTICPCCGTEFDADDFEVTHSELRRMWEENGMQWYSNVIQQPANYNPIAQLRKLFANSVANFTPNNVVIELDVNDLRFKDQHLREDNFVLYHGFYRLNTAGNGTVVSKNYAKFTSFCGL